MLHDLAEKIFVVGVLLHCARFPPHVHQHDGYTKLRHGLGHVWIHAHGRDFIDDVGSSSDRFPGHAGFHGVDRYGNVTLPADSSDYRENPVELDVGRYRLGIGASRLAAQPGRGPP